MLWWHWMLFGLVLLGLETLTPGGFFVFFFGLAALLVGGGVALSGGGPAWLQWLLFSALSIVSLMLFRNRLLAYFKATSGGSEVDSLQGAIALPVHDIAPGAVGKVELRGTSWTARNADTSDLKAGQRCRVERVEGLMLWIRGE